MRVRSLVKGLLTFVPGLASLFPLQRGGHTHSVRYCYSVWLKHLTLLGELGMTRVPETIAELGPGESIGVGIAAILSGARRYFGLDVASHWNTQQNLQLVNDLAALFEARSPRPDKGWPDFDPFLDERLFPSHLLTPELLRETLAPERIANLRDALTRPNGDDGAITLKYMAPWTSPRVLKQASVDLIVSHSVLEHVVDLEETYRALYSWLKPGGRMSHQIDFRSHGLSTEWNGYRKYSEFTWTMLRGRRPFLINREPCSVHLSLMQQAGFEIDCALKNMRTDGIRREQLSPQWASLSDEDLMCSGLFVQAHK
jgi:Methyltransferase domain